MLRKIQEGMKKKKRHIIRFGNCTVIIGGCSGSNRKCNRYYCYRIHKE